MIGFNSATTSIMDAYSVIQEKKNDVVTLRGLGADDRLISRIFLFEGCLISFLGALVGVVLGWREYYKLFSKWHNKCKS